MATTTITLLDAWKRAKGITSDNQAAIALGVGRAAVSSWRGAIKQASPPLAARMARELGLDELKILAAIEGERAIDAETRRTWTRLAGKALAIALITLAAWIAPPERALAAPTALDRYPSSRSIAAAAVLVAQTRYYAKY
jgi:hypothetical protein